MRSIQSAAIEEENARFMAAVYRWMTFGLLFTSSISYAVGNSNIVTYLIQNKFLFYILIFLQLGSVLFFSFKIKTMSAAMASVIYFIYAGLTGLTFSTIFLIYTQESILNAFFITSFSFGGLSAFGLITKKDLGPVGTFCSMGLWGLIGFGLITLFFPSLMTSKASKIYSIAGILIFSGLTAYDTQKIRNMNIIGNEGTEEDHKEAIYGALTLYLDFINLFLNILRLMGNRRR